VSTEETLHSIPSSTSLSQSLPTPSQVSATLILIGSHEHARDIFPALQLSVNPVLQGDPGLIEPSVVLLQNLHVLFLLPQIPHASTVAGVGFGWSSHPLQLELSPPQTPHSSISFVPFGVPEQSEHVELLPLQISNSSINFLLVGIAVKIPLVPKNLIRSR
jgi:hypothetical protein